MPTKLIACLLAACVVAGGGVYLMMDHSSGCGGCPLSKLMASKTDCPDCLASSGEACSGDTAACCSTAKASVKATCCADEVCSSKDPMTAGLGGAASYATK